MKGIRVPEQLYLSVMGLISLPKEHTFFRGNQSNEKALIVYTLVKRFKEKKNKNYVELTNNCFLQQKLGPIA